MGAVEEIAAAVGSRKALVPVYCAIMGSASMMSKMRYGSVMLLVDCSGDYVDVDIS
jgi:hypothetical protein